MGFPADKEENGKIMKIEATISQESRQRCKASTHKYQTEMRLEIENALKTKKSCKAQDKIDLLQMKIDQNAACERNICELLHKDDVQSEYIQEATHDIFYKCTCD